MAGADHTGDDMEAGRTNRAENRTAIWAQTEKDSDFDGDAILVVEAAPNVEDDDYKLVNAAFPSHGILSSGIGTGAGVVGFSRRSPLLAPGEELTPTDLRNASNVGVFGKGFTGIAAQGDFRSSSTPSADLNMGRGVGIIGRGDRGLNLSAPGVVGFSGGVTNETFGANTGVFGKGETGVSGRGTKGPGVKGMGSPQEPGIMGVGGSNSPKGRHAPGVMGLGFNEPIGFPFEVPVNTGVYGAGDDGVKGQGDKGRGGVFESAKSAQVRLVPVRKDLKPERGSYSPTIVANPGVLGPKLPKYGQAGDLMSVIDDRGECTLWFCVVGHFEVFFKGSFIFDPARWAQVLLGPVFIGQA